MFITATFYRPDSAKSENPPGYASIFSTLIDGVHKSWTRYRTCEYTVVADALIHNKLSPNSIPRSV